MSYKEYLDVLKQNSHFREIKDFTHKDEKYIEINGKKLINLSSNNYLGFADNNAVTQEFLETTGAKYCFGSASARLLTGTLPVYKELELLLAKLFNKDSALIFNSGYHANVGINSSIAGKGDVIFSDKLNHASIIDGMRLSEGKFFRYPHNNMEALEKLLIRERKNFNNAIIVSESVFSMDGDIADLRKLVELKEKYNCILILDEAHAFGVFGQNGLGVSETLSIIDNVDLIVGTFGKAIGSMGAFAVGNKTLIDYLTNKARSFIFSTALPPINIAFTKWIIENKLPKTYEKRMNMIKLGKKITAQLTPLPNPLPQEAREAEINVVQQGYVRNTPQEAREAEINVVQQGYVRNTPQGAREAKINVVRQGYVRSTPQGAREGSHIIPIIIGSNKETVETCEILYQNGFFTLPIRPPTVPEGTSRLRLSLTTDITEQEIQNAISLAKQTK